MNEFRKLMETLEAIEESDYDDERRVNAYVPCPDCKDNPRVSCDTCTPKNKVKESESKSVEDLLQELAFRINENPDSSLRDSTMETLEELKDAIDDQRQQDAWDTDGYDD